MILIMSEEGVTKKQELPALTNNPSTFYGTLFYPHITIVAGQKRETEEPATDMFAVLQPSNIVLDIPFKKGRRVIVYKNGYVLISFGTAYLPFGFKKEENEKAREFLNLIFAEAMFSPPLFAEASPPLFADEAPPALFFHAVRYLDMTSLTLDANTLQPFQGSLGSLTSPRLIPLMTNSGQLTPGPPPEISVNTIEEIIRRAEQTRTSDPKRRERIIFLLESWTHFVNGEFAQSFILSWLIIEKQINDLWEQQIDSQKKIDYRDVDDDDLELNKKINDRFGKLKNHNLYVTDIKIEILKFLGVLTLDQYDQFMRFKDVRNDITHPRKAHKEITSEEAYDLWYLTFCSLWNLTFLPINR